MNQLVSLSTTLAIIVILAACDPGGVTAAQVESLIEERIASKTIAAVENDSLDPNQKTLSVEAANDLGKVSEQRGPAKAQEAVVLELSAPKLTAAGLSSSSVENAEGTVGFFLTLQELMDGYAAELPDIPVNDVLQCVTTHEKGLDKELKKLETSLSKEVSSAKKERTKQQREFRNRIEPPNYRLDYAWKTRKGFTRVDIYSCYDPADYTWDNSEGRGDCHYSWRLRRVRYIADDNVFLYSNSAKPAPPELMTRMKNKGVVAPEKAHCIVRDAYTKTRKEQPPVHWIECKTETESLNLRLRLTTPVENLQVGDLVTVPVRDVVIAQSVVSREQVKQGWNTETRWVVDVDTTTLAISEARANCPARADISGEICKHADRKTSALDLVNHCTQSRSTKTVYEKAKSWDKKRLRDKNKVMLIALDYLSEHRADDLWVWRTLARYKTLVDDKAAALTAHAKALALADKPTDHLLIAEDAKRLGDMALYKSAIQKACDKGLRAACGMVPE